MMKAIEKAIAKGSGGKFKGDDDSVPESSSAYRSSDTSGGPNVGSKSYSRDTAGWEGDSIDQRQNDPNASSFSSREGGASGYSSESSGSMNTGIGGERSTSGFSGDSSRDNNPSHSSMSSGDNSYASSSRTTSSSDNYRGGSDSGRYHSSKECSHRSRNVDYDDDNNGNNSSYSSYSGGPTGDSIGDDETGDIGGGVHNSRGIHGSASHSGRSSGGGMSGGNQSYGAYASAD